MQALEQTLWVKTSVGGMSRYENDDDYRCTCRMVALSDLVDTAVLGGAAGRA